MEIVQDVNWSESFKVKLSDRQKLICGAVKKMSEAENLFKEGWLEFNQLTQGAGKGSLRVIKKDFEVRETQAPKRLKRSKGSKGRVRTPARGSSVTETVLNALKDGPLPPSVLKAKAGCEKTAMYRALKELVAAGKVHKTGKTRDAIWILGPSKSNGHTKGPWRATA